MMIKSGKIQKGNKKSLKAKGKGKANSKGKDKQGYIPKPKNPKPTAKEHPAKDDTCHHCKKVGHWKRNCLVYLAELLKKKKQVGIANSSGDLNEPSSYKAVILDPNSNKWFDVMNAKMQSMIDNMVLVLFDLPSNCKTVGSKWIFKKKTDMDGIVHTYKARLVEKGYTQLYGDDYEETFSPVAEIRAIRILISMAAFYDYEIWQMDVKIAFLNGYLDEDIYMVQPEGFVDPKNPKKVCKLQRYIYGLKQASRSWNKRFDEEIKNLQSVKDYLGKCFAMKDLGEATFILGIKIYRDGSKQLIGLSQSAYMYKILKRYRMDNSKRGHIPMQERLDLKKTQGASTPEEVKRMQNVPYASAVGSIMYAVKCTRPDVAFVQNITSRFQQNPGAVDWKSSKQSTTAMSATEAEYIATSETAMEAVWIRKFISGLGIVPTINEPIKMFCDNSVALLIANEPGRDYSFDPSGFAWCYTYVYIQGGVTFIAKSDDPKALAFEEDDPDALDNIEDLAIEIDKKKDLAFEFDNPKALVFLPPNFGNHNSSMSSSVESSYYLSNDLDGSLLYTMSGELYTISPQLLSELKSKEDGPYVLSKSKLLSKLMIITLQIKMMSLKVLKDSSRFAYFKGTDALALLIYVDDILLAGINISLIIDIKV
ncbi:retrotransposon protein, putative, ty1-copia subclass [Tanacetum coccineum]